MRALAILLVCLACTGEGHRAQLAHGRAQANTEEGHESFQKVSDMASRQLSLGETKQHQSDSSAAGWLPGAGMRSAAGTDKAGNPTGLSRSPPAVMDETLFEKALRGELEQEGAENVFLSEAGWATYLDKEAGQSYAMNERVSEAQDGYFTPDVFSNPIDNVIAWFDSVKRYATQPLETAFPTISNDKSGARSFGKGTEIKARTIQPKTKDFNPELRQTGRGFNWFGSPSLEKKPDPTEKPKFWERFGKKPEPTEKPFFWEKFGKRDEDA